jgi:hypothetical protein
MGSEVGRGERLVGGSRGCPQPRSRSGGGMQFGQGKRQEGIPVAALPPALGTAPATFGTGRDESV